MWDFWTHLFDPSGFPPRWDCGAWTLGHGWLHILSDLGVSAAYFVIPCVLGFYAIRRKDIPFRGVLRLFVAFIVMCGTTHLMEAVLFWWPAYRLAGILKLITAVISWATVFALIRVMPQMMALRSPAAFEKEIAERHRVEGDLQVLHASLERRVAERTAELQASEERFRIVVEAAPSGLIMMGQDGRIVFANDLIVRMFGWEKAELVGQPVERLLPERYRERHPADRASYFAAPVGRLMGAGRDLTGRRKDGSEFPVEIGLQPVNMAGEVFALASVIDISARKQTEADLRASEERFRIVVEAAPSGLIMMGQDGRIVFANDLIVRMFGWEKAELVGQPVERLLPERYRERHPADRASYFAAPVGRLMGAGRDLTGRRNDGSEFPVEIGLQPVNMAGEVFALASVIDISARKQAEANLRASEERYRLAVAATGMGQWDTPFPQVTLGWDTRLKAIWGLPADAVVTTDTHHSLIHPDDQANVEREATEALDPLGSGSFAIEHRILTQDGAVRWVAVWGQTVFAGPPTDRQPVRSIGVMLDETSRQEIKAAVQESADRLKMALVNAQLGMWDLDVATGRLSLDSHFLKILGYNPSERPEQLETWVQRLHPEDRPMVMDVLTRHLACDKILFDVEYRMRTMLGEWIWINSRGRVQVRTAEGTAVRMAGTIQDITIRKGAELSLVASEALLRQFITHAPAAIAMLDTEMHYLRVSDQWCKDYRLSEADVIGRSHYEVFPEIAENWKAIHRRVLLGAVEACDEDLFLRADGTEEWLQWEARPWRMPDGEIGGLIIFTQLITARKRVEADLHLSEERFQAFMNYAPLAAWMVDEEFRGVYASPGFDRLTGLTPRALLGRTIAELFPSGFAAANMANSERVLATGRPVEDEVELIGPDGSVGVAYVVKFPVRGPEGRTLVGNVAIDITERKRAEELVKASLREKEVLLKEIHHRVKNNLQIVSTLLDLQSGHTTDRAALEMFQMSRSRVKSMALIHERLYRAQDMARVDFAEYIRQLTDDLFRTYKISGDIRLELDVDIPPLTIDIAIPCGLLLNELISNCLKHAFTDAPHGCLRVALHRDNGASVLTVGDDGPGFPAGTDFRNTTSFGLQLVTTLVDQLDGEISMTSNGGTTFTVRFPKATSHSPGGSHS
jgi:PAS domain S-box-containing protein